MPPTKIEFNLPIRFSNAALKHKKLTQHNLIIALSLRLKDLSELFL